MTTNTHSSKLARNQGKLKLTQHTLKKMTL